MLSFVSALLIGCQKHAVNKTERNIVKGDWVIRNYTEDGIDLTNSGLTEYVFNFSKDGEVRATIKTLSVLVIGEWSALKSEKKAIFDLKMNSPLDRLTEQWEILVSQKNSISMSVTTKKGIKKSIVFFQENDGK
jgi:hypothetical protein